MLPLRSTKPSSSSSSSTSTTMTMMIRRLFSRNRHLVLPTIICLTMIVLPVFVLISTTTTTTTIVFDTTRCLTSSSSSSSSLSSIDHYVWMKMLQQEVSPPPQQQQQQQQQASQQRQRPEAPYNEYCETTPRNELQLWNTRKKVISFALFSSSSSATLKRYFIDGLRANVRLSQLYFPEWVTRVYTFNLSDEQIQLLIGIDPARVEVVKCRDSSSMNQLDNARRMISRFLVVDDPTVEFSLIRDVDSRPTVRELLAVNEWMSSGLKFHTIRDHRYHRVPVMGGMFGMRRGVFDGIEEESSTATMTEIVSNAFELYPTKKIPGTTQDDQNFLQKFIWRLVKDNAMDHDMDGGHRCQLYGSKVCRRFPIEGGGRDDGYSFVGYPFKPTEEEEGINVTASHFECTMSCRAEYNEEYQDVLISNQRPPSTSTKTKTEQQPEPEKQTTITTTTKISGRVTKRQYSTDNRFGLED